MSLMMSGLHRRVAMHAGRERGAVLIVTAGMAVVLMGFMGLGIDVGMLYRHKCVMQTAADAGALGGGSEIYRGQASLITSSALAATAENGYVHGTEGVTVTVNHPPLGGFYAGDTDAVEVLIAQPSPTYFMRLFGWTSVGILARAVAWAGANDKNCIYVMEEIDQDAFLVQQQCPIGRRVWPEGQLQ